MSMVIVGSSFVEVPMWLTVGEVDGFSHGAFESGEPFDPKANLEESVRN